MAHIVALDIETIPDEAQIAEFIRRGPDKPIEAPSNYKDPAKIAEYVNAKVYEWQAGLVKVCSLDPAYGRIACVGIGTDELVTTTDLDTEGSEEALLAAAWDRLSTVDGIVTFNGIGFDWRWLMIRSAILRVKPSRVFHAVRYRHWPVCDIMAILADWQPDKWRKLGEWCRVFGVRCEGKEAGIDGSQVWPMIQRGEWGAVRDYCAGDVRATWRLYRVLEEYGIVMPMPEVGK